MTEHIRRKATVEGIEFVRYGDAMWSEGDGTLWTCLQCADGRTVAGVKAHAAWHIRGKVGTRRPPLLPTLGDREAIDDE